MKGDGSSSTGEAIRAKIRQPTTAPLDGWMRRQTGDPLACATGAEMRRVMAERKTTPDSQSTDEAVDDEPMLPVELVLAGAMVAISSRVHPLGELGSLRTHPLSENGRCCRSN